MFQPPGYQSFFRSRQDKRGGGVALLLRDDIVAKPIDEFTDITSDYKVLTMQSHNNTFSIVYRPPSGDTIRFLVFLEKLFRYTLEEKINLILGGDVNISMLSSSPLQKDLQSLITTYGFSNSISTATRVTIEGASLLDVRIHFKHSYRFIRGRRGVH